MGKRRELQKRIEDERQIRAALMWAEKMIRWGLQAGPVFIRLGRERRTLEQNALMWPLLTDLSQQVRWHGLTLKPDEWKDLATACFRGQRVVPGIEGGFVAIGTSTSAMSKKKFSEFIEYLFAFGAEQGVQWSHASMKSTNKIRGGSDAANSDNYGAQAAAGNVRQVAGGH